MSDLTVFDPRAVKRTWIFMYVALAIYAWPFYALSGGKLGWLGVAHILGFGTPRPAPILGWILAAVVVILFCAAGMRGYPLIRQHVFDLGGIKLVAVVFAFFSGVMEEVWFRLLLMNWAQSHGFGPVAQALVSALIFGAAHAIWGVGARNLRVAFASMIATGLLGAGLGTVFLASDRVVAPCIWAHATINLILEPWLLIAAMTRGLSAKPALR